MTRPFQSVVLTGYIVDIKYLDSCPPGKYLLAEHGYYDGYYKIIVTVTKDNLSVTEQMRELFMIRPYGDPSEHGTLKFGDTMVIPLGANQKILHLVTGCKHLHIGHEPADFDLLLFLLSTEQEADYGSAWILLKHDKEDIVNSVFG
ncbi:MAG: hypothetical protein RL538_361 [Candidatus Parcubacteria bacterium]|jgi:hypothetical protein